MKYKIKEIFGPTIQGEGKYAGIRCHFIRFSGCNRDCEFCDTDWSDGYEASLSEIESRLSDLGEADDVVLTGGEPMLQVDENLLRLLVKKYRVHIETNGSIDIPPKIINFFRHITCSPKQSAANTALNCFNELKILYPYQWDEPSEYRNKWPGSISIQPLFGTNNTDKIIEELKKYKDSRLSVQLHKYVEVK